MGSVPTVPTTPAGQLVTSGQLQSIEGAVSFLLNPPRCFATVSTAQSIPTNSATPLNFTTENYDTDGMHSTSSSTDRITCHTAGLYHATCNIGFGSGSESIILEIRRNGGYIDGGSVTIASGSTYGLTGNVSTDVYLNVGDYLQVYAVLSTSDSDATGLLNGSSFQVRWVAVS